MTAGYFRNGTVDVALGEHASQTPSASRTNVRLAPARRAARIMDAGGGMLQLAVRAQAQRADVGDAERYVYELLRALAMAAPGELGCEDYRGFQATVARAVCIGAEGSVRADCIADVDCEFLAPTDDASPAWTSVPALPGPYGGTDSSMSYAAGGVALGTHGESMRVAMTRQFPVRPLPRARGARPWGPARNADIRLTVTAHALAESQHLADYLIALERQIGPRAVDLTANGNTYRGVVLSTLRARPTDKALTRFDAEFLMQVA